MDVRVTRRGRSARGSSRGGGGGRLQIRSLLDHEAEYAAQLEEERKSRDARLEPVERKERVVRRPSSDNDDKEESVDWERDASDDIELKEFTDEDDDDTALNSEFYNQTRLEAKRMEWQWDRNRGMTDLEYLPDGERPEERIQFLDLETHTVIAAPPICQISSISLDGKHNFNRYVRWGYLDPAFAKHADKVAIDPWDWETTPVFIEVMKRFVSWHKEYTVFFHYGHNDYKWILHNFIRHQPNPRTEVIEEEKEDEEEKEREEEKKQEEERATYNQVLEKFVKNQYQFINIWEFLRYFGEETGLSSHLGLPYRGKAPSTLSEVYDHMFRRSLLISTKEEMLVDSDDVRAVVKTTLDKWYKLLGNDEMDSDANKEQKSASLKMTFWTDKHLQPLSHYAHSDALMMREIVIMMVLYLEVRLRIIELRGQKQHEIDLYSDVATSVMIQTVFFRKFHLGWSDRMTHFFFLRATAKAHWTNHTHNALIEIERMRSSVSNAIRKGAALDGENDMNEGMSSISIRRNLGARRPDEILSTHDVLFQSGDLRDELKDDDEVSGLRQAKVIISGNELKVNQPLDGRAPANRLDLMRTFIIDRDARLQGPSDDFAFDPFARLIHDAQLAFQLRRNEDLPYWFSARAIGTKFPNTVVLHTAECKTLADPHAPSVSNQAFRTKAIAYIDLSKPQTLRLPWMFKFCKVCKRRVRIPNGFKVERMTKKLLKERAKVTEYNSIEPDGAVEDDDDGSLLLRPKVKAEPIAAASTTTAAIDRLTDTLAQIAINPNLVSHNRRRTNPPRPVAPKYSIGPFYSEKEALYYANPANRTKMT